MSLFNVFQVSSSAMTAQSMRLNAVASNLANADSIVSSDGKPYRAKQVVFEATPLGANGELSKGVRVRQVVEDASPARMVYDPKNPAADDKGYVAFPNVNVVEEMTNMISASRSYQTNVETARAGASLKPQDQTIVPQSIAPIFGLAATRTAHGRDALNILRRDFCRPQTGEDGDPRVRMVHIALPKPDPARGEAAPMNWVLNEQACDYLLNKAPWLGFNVRQARRLNDTIDAVRAVTLRASQPDKPSPIDCSP